MQERKPGASRIGRLYGLYATAQFNTAGVQVDPNFGAYNAARAPRIIQFSLRLNV